MDSSGVEISSGVPAVAAAALVAGRSELMGSVEPLPVSASTGSVEPPPSNTRMGSVLPPPSEPTNTRIGSVPPPPSNTRIGSVEPLPPSATSRPRLLQLATVELAALGVVTPQTRSGLIGSVLPAPSAQMMTLQTLPLAALPPEGLWGMIGSVEPLPSHATLPRTPLPAAMMTTEPEPVSVNSVGPLSDGLMGVMVKPNEPVAPANVQAPPVTAALPVEIVPRPSAGPVAMRVSPLLK